MAAAGLKLIALGDRRSTFCSSVSTMEAMDVEDVGLWLHEQGFSKEVIDSFCGEQINHWI